MRAARLISTATTRIFLVNQLSYTYTLIIISINCIELLLTVNNHVSFYISRQEREKYL